LLLLSVTSKNSPRTHIFYGPNSILIELFMLPANVQHAAFSLSSGYLYGPDIPC
jgi:hypothetical protein